MVQGAHRASGAGEGVGYRAHGVRRASGSKPLVAPTRFSTLGYKLCPVPSTLGYKLCPIPCTLYPVPSAISWANPNPKPNPNPNPNPRL